MIRILIADDANLIRKALNIYFKVESDLEIVGTAANGKTALKLVGELNPDIVLMDMEMPEMDGLTATQIIRKCFPQTKILVISGHNSQDYVAKALKAGANGYFIKSTPAEELSEAIRLIHEQDVRIIPALSTEKSYRILPSSLINIEDTELSPELLRQKVYAGESFIDLEETLSANQSYSNNSSTSSTTKWRTDTNQSKIPSLSLGNSQEVLAAISCWKNKKKIALMSVFGLSIFMTTVLKYRTTVEAHAQISTNSNIVAAIAPSQQHLLVKASVPSEDIAKVETNQEVELKVFGCPHHNYGTLHGKTVAVSSGDNSQWIQPENPYTPQQQSNFVPNGKSYEVTIEPASLSLKKNNNKCYLKSGMKAKADIVTQEETILAFLLRKAKLMN